MTESPLKNRRRPTAFHEAGHAIVGHFLGLEVHDICINDKDKSGDTNFVPKELTTTEKATLQFAGMAAQNIWKAISEHMSGGGDIGDFLNMTTDLSDEERDKLRAKACERANSILLAHKSSVEAVAEWLMERGQMDGSEFKRLMRDA
jgi:ATP-dependent Zn protease